MIYLIEPYNAYQKPPRKKHPTEIAEEEALFYYIMEQQRLEQERLLTEKSAVQQTLNLALQAFPEQPPSQQVQDASPGLAGAPGGAGGVPYFKYFQEGIEEANFSYTLATVGAPTSASFTNLSPTPTDDTFLWILTSSYGKVTSTAINFPNTILDTGSYNLTLQETSSVGHMTSKTVTITVPLPTLTVGFSLSAATGSAPFTESFTNTTTTTGGKTDLTYRWIFGDGTTSAVANPTHVYNTGSFTARLEATTSYNVTASTTHDLTGSFPVVTAAFTEVGPTGVAPITTSFINSSAINNGVAPTTYFWTFGDGATSTSANPTHSYDTGSFTVILRATGSYNAAGSVTHTLVISASVPSVVPTLTVTTSSNVGPMTASFTASVAYNGHGTLSGTIFDIPAGNRVFTTNPMTFETIEPTGSFTASFQVTESSYQRAAKVFATPWSASVT